MIAYTLFVEGLEIFLINMDINNTKTNKKTMISICLIDEYTSKALSSSPLIKRSSDLNEKI